MNNVFFKAGLSNGEVCYEHKLPQSFELSRWKHLMQKVAQEDFKITSLSLYTLDGATFNLPATGKNPKFKEFANLLPPFNYNFFRKIGQNLDGSPLEIYAVIEAIYETYSLQLWVSDENTKNCWVLIK